MAEKTGSFLKRQLLIVNGRLRKAKGIRIERINIGLDKENFDNGKK